MQVNTTMSSPYPNSPPSADSSGQTIGSRVLGKNDFLKLLVTQLRSQDPLQPVTNEAFVAQLAQFSSLEQMQNINQNLTGSLQSSYLLNATINNSLATTMIGSEVKVATNELFTTQPTSIDCGVEIDKAYRKVSFEIYNEKNELVKTISIDSPSHGSNKVHWDGTNEQGVEVPAGVYRFEATAEAFDGSTSRPAAFLAGTVTGVRYRNGSAIMLIGGVEVLPSEIIEVNKP
jgi:flagellar basal-body rod modification protein FlgD